MNRKAVKLAALCLTGTIAIGSQGIAANASDLNSLLPRAGMDAVMNDIYSTSTDVIIRQYLEATVNSEYQNLAISNVNDYVNIREEASEESESLGKLYADSAATVLGQKGEWVEVQSGTVTGYIREDYLLQGEEAEERAEEVGQKKATVSTETLRVREDDSTDAGVVTLVGIGDELDVKDETDDGWYEISSEDGTGYVSGDYVEVKTVFKEAESREEEAARLEAERKERERQEEEARKQREAEEAAAAAAQQAAAAESSNSGSQSSNSGSSSSSSESSNSGSSSSSSESSNSGSSESSNSGSSESSSGSSTASGSGQAVADYAVQFVGNPYVWGGTSLTNGADCSGFILSVYKNFGVSLPHSSSAMRSYGTAVDYADAQPGDIICYDGHVALYIGGGQIVHASSAKTGIKISNATYRNILTVRRLV